MKFFVSVFYNNKLLFKGEHDSPLMNNQLLYENGAIYKVVRQAGGLCKQQAFVVLLKKD